jgi:hypothetical protein
MPVEVERLRQARFPSVPWTFRAAAACACLAAAPFAALASPAATEVVPPPKGAPFVIESCAVDASVFGAAVVVRVKNLDASRALQHLTVSLPLYDDAHVRKTVASASFTAMQLAPGESGEFRDEYVSVNLPSEVRRTLRAATCRFVFATYDGGATWKPGKPWRGKLIPTNAGASPTA